MRVESLNLPQAAQNRSKVQGSGNAFPGIPAEKTAASGITNTEKAAKNTLHGLDNAISRLEAKQSSNQGIEHALEMLNRNLSRHQDAPPVTDTGSATSATDGDTAGSTT